MIKLLDAVKFHKDLPHQIEAWEFLQRTVHKEVLDEFARLYRNEKITIDSSGLPEEGVKLIKEFEGFSEKTYYDPHTGGLPITAAYGSTRKLDGTPFYIGETITREEGEKLLIHQLKKEFLPALQKIPYWDQMNDKMKSSLISFAYNLGANFYNSNGFNTISRVLKNKEWDKVPKTLELYRNPGSNVEPGLLRRRKKEGELWSQGLQELNK